jgi:2-polyprenyl-6-methoxyphenol hydroxylase-like FAD-dependent oxidoreductase
MSNHTLDINTILHTKDGRKIGNAIVVGREGYHWQVKTDYGNIVTFTSEEIDKHFYIAWENCSEEHDGLTCDEMQKMMQEDHKHRTNE